MNSLEIWTGGSGPGHFTKLLVGLARITTGLVETEGMVTLNMSLGIYRVVCVD